MTSKKPPSSKRAVVPRASDRTKAFVRDWTRLSQSPLRHEAAQGGDDAARGQRWALGPEWLDHPLTGDWTDHRECHVGGDFLLIYRLDGSGTHEQIIFVRAGTHAELFE